MRSVCTDQSSATRRWMREDVAAHMSSSEVDRSQTGQHQVREVLAHSTALGDHLHYGRRDRRCLRIELELLMNAIHERAHAHEQRGTRGETRVRPRCELTLV